MSKPTKTKTINHRGENRPDIAAQIRLYPEKKGAEEETTTTERSSDEIAKFSIKNDENYKGTDDNLIKVEVPWIDKLEHEAEAWLGNLISIHNQVFLRKGWTGGKSLEKRLETYQKFLRKRAINSFQEATLKARKEFLDAFDWESRDMDRSANMNKNRERDEKSFLMFIDDVQYLAEMDYVDDVDANATELAEGRDRCRLDYEKSISSTSV